MKHEKDESGPRKRRSKKDGSSPAPRSRGKGPRGRSKAGDGETPETPVPPPVEPPQTPPPPPPPPPPAPPSRDEGRDWDRADGEELDGKVLLMKLRHLLAATPKAKEEPALAFVLLAGSSAMATSDVIHHATEFSSPISQTHTKVTRGAIEALAALIDGELKSAMISERSLLVRWTGLIVEMRRSGSDEIHRHMLDRFDGGPTEAALALAPTEYTGHATLDIDTLRESLAVKTPGTLHLFVSAEKRRVDWQVHHSGETVARGSVAYAGASLGVKQQQLPMAMGGKPLTPAAPPQPSQNVAELQRVVLQLAAGSEWVTIVVNYSAAWDRIPATELSVLSPYEIDHERGLVVFGPYPRQIPRVAELMRRLRRLDLDPREITAEAPNLFNRQLGAGEEITPEGLRLDAGAPAESEVVRLFRTRTENAETEDRLTTLRIGEGQYVELVWEGQTDAGFPVWCDVPAGLVDVLREVAAELGVELFDAANAPIPTNDDAAPEDDAPTSTSSGAPVIDAEFFEDDAAPEDDDLDDTTEGEA